MMIEDHADENYENDDDVKNVDVGEGQLTLADGKADRFCSAGNMDERRRETKRSDVKCLIWNQRRIFPSQRFVLFRRWTPRVDDVNTIVTSCV